MEGAGLQKLRHVFYNICTKINNLDKITSNSHKDCQTHRLAITPKGAISHSWITPVTAFFLFCTFMDRYACVNTEMAERLLILWQYQCRVLVSSLTEMSEHLGLSVRTTINFVLQK
jgi:hypothetical protein